MNWRGLATRRNALIAAPLALLVGGATVIVVTDSGPALTLTAQVSEGQVSKMVTAKGVVAAAKTANLSFKSANSIKTVDVKVGDKVRKGQKVGEMDAGTPRFNVLVAEGSLASAQAALDLILNDVNPAGLAKIADRAKDVADQAEKNIDLKEEADRKAYKRLKETVEFDRAAIESARQKLSTDACTQDGTARSNIGVPGAASPLLTGGPAQAMVFPDPSVASKAQSQCAIDYAAFVGTRKAYFQDTTAFINAKKNIWANRGPLRSAWRAALQGWESAKNSANIARVNRPNQILAAKAAVANAQTNVAAAQSALKDRYVYSPADGVVTAIGNSVGEFSAGGNNLTPGTPVGPGGTAKIPLTGPLAQGDKTSSSNTNAGQLSAVSPTGGAFMQISDLTAFQVVAAYPEADVAQITPGALSKVSFDALPGKDYDGTVTAVQPIGVAGPDGKTYYYATVLLNSAPDNVRSGMAANVSVTVATVENKAFVVPTSAVQGSDSSPYVYVPGTDGTPQKRSFVKGKVGDDNTQVMQGLKPGDTVLVPETGALPRPDKDAFVPPAPAADQPMNVVIDQPKPTAPPQMLPVNIPPVNMGQMPGMDPSTMDPSMGMDPSMMDPTAGLGPDSLDQAAAGADPGAAAAAGPGN